MPHWTVDDFLVVVSLACRGRLIGSCAKRHMVLHNRGIPSVPVARRGRCGCYVTKCGQDVLPYSGLVVVECM